MPMRPSDLCLPLLLAFAGCGSAPVFAVPPARKTVAREASPALPAPRPPAESTASPPEAFKRPSSPPARLLILNERTRIWPSPAVKGDRFIATLRIGQTIVLQSAGTVRGQGCPGGFFAVEPRGYVCREDSVPLGPDESLETIAAALAPEAGPFPYRYALSTGAPMYNRIPLRAEQERAERFFERAGALQPLPRSSSAHADLAVSESIAPTDPLLAVLASGSFLHPDRSDLVHQVIPLGSMLAYTKAFDIEGRTFLLSSDLTLVPADRVRPFRRSEFRGVRLGKDAALPLAWFRQTPRPQFRLLPSGAVEKTGVHWPVRSFAALTGKTTIVAGVRYLETRQTEAGETLYAAAADATVVEPLQKIPAGVRTGQKWMLVRITQGTLVAYEGLTPIYATLISPGAGGLPTAGQDPVRASTTPLGAFYVTFKDRAATMSPDRGKDRRFWIAGVPHTQYFNPPFALHASYWHERFGEPTSAGCINLSPIDAEVLFEWSDPPVPPGWQGATGAGAPENGPTTAVVIRR